MDNEGSIPGNGVFQEFSALPRIVGESPAIITALSLVEQAAQNDVPVLLTGERGTGKELIARWIHARSHRQSRSFVVLNSSVGDDLCVERELWGEWGKRRGIFAEAAEGTLLLEEISQMSLPLQFKLRHVLAFASYVPLAATSPQKLTARIMASTHRELGPLVDEGKFLRDLYVQLGVVEIHLPPLRRRREDIPLLAQYYLDYYARERGFPPRRLRPEVIHAFTAYSWPGNVWELRSEAERLFLLGEGSEIGTEHLSPHILLFSAQPNRRRGQGHLKGVLEEMEREMILAALHKHGWNRSRAARELGISRSNLLAKVARYGLDHWRRRSLLSQVS